MKIGVEAKKRCFINLKLRNICICLEFTIFCDNIIGNVTAGKWMCKNKSNEFGNVIRN